MSTTTTVTLSKNLHDQVRALAEATGRTFEEVLAETVAQGLAYDRWFRAEVEKGVRSAAQGPLMPAEDVWADFLARGLLTTDAIAHANDEADDDPSESA
jgi:predicted transcriptional regulator